LNREGAVCLGLSFKGVLNYKTLLVLLLVVLVNLVAAVLVWRLDLFVHSDLYEYGLVYSLGWADSYWYCTAMIWALLGGATALAVAAIIPHYLHSQKISGFSVWMGFILPVLAIIYQGISVFFLSQKNSMVWNALSDYGLRYDVEWATTYNLISLSALALMVTALVALIIPIVRVVRHEPERTPSAKSADWQVAEPVRS
jgi:hypothetical protein